MKNNQSTLFSRVAIVSAISLLVTACDGGAHQDLTKFVADTKAAAAKTSKIDDLPDIQPYETYLFDQNISRNPFAASVAEEDEVTTASSNGVQPPRDRRKEPLEAYPLDGLRMVGTLEQDDKLWAIISVVNNAEGGIHRVSLDNYMGQNYGRVVSITEDKIDLIEIIPNGLGGWIEQNSSIALSEE